MTPASVTVFQIRTVARALAAAGMAALVVVLLAPFTDYGYLATPASLTAALLAAAAVCSSRASRMQDHVDGQSDRL